MAITVAMRTQVSQLYVALFGRAPDAEGLSFWVQKLDAGESMTQVANEMFATDPARAYYPGFLTNQEIIASFYVNVLGRTADAEGLAFWTAKLNTAGATPGSVINEMITAVANYVTNGGSDPAGLTSAALFNNKVAVAQYYGEHAGNIADATVVLATVTADPATVTAAEAAIAAGTIGQDGISVTLTAAQDTVNGTPATDEVHGIIGGAGETYQAGDSIDLGAGAADTVALVVAAAVTSAQVTVKNAETITIQDTLGAEFDALLVENSPTITFTNTLDTQVSKVKNGSIASTYGLSGKGDLTVDFASTSATTDVAKLSVNGVGTSSTNTSVITVADGNTVEGVTIATSGTNFISLVGGTAAKTLTVTGGGTNVFDLSSGTALAAVSTIDASAATGANTFSVGGNLNTTDVVKGGTGADTLSFAVNLATQMKPTTTGVETLKADFNAAGTLDLSAATGATTVTLAGGLVDAKIVKATSSVTNLNIATQDYSDTTADNVSFSYGTGQEAALTVNLGDATSAATDMILGTVALDGTTSVTVNTVGTKVMDLADLTIAGDQDAIAINVGAGSFLEFGQIGGVGEVGSFTVNLAAGAGYSGGISGGGDIGDVVFNVGDGASGQMWIGNANGDVGSITITATDGQANMGVGISGGGNLGSVTVNLTGKDTSGSYLGIRVSGGMIGDISLSVDDGARLNAEVSADAFEYGDTDEDGTDGNIGNVAISIGNDSFISANFTASGGDIGNITVNMFGENASGQVYVKASMLSGDVDGDTSADDYVRGGNVGDVTINVTGEDANLDANVIASGGNIGDVSFSVTGDGASGWLQLSAQLHGSGGTGGNIGDLAFTVGTGASGEMGIWFDGTIGDITATVGAGAYGGMYFSGGASGDAVLSDVNGTVGDDGELFVGVSGFGGDTGVVTIAGVGAAQAYAHFAQVSGDIGGVDLSTGDNGQAGVMFSGNAGDIGSVSLTVGDGSSGFAIFQDNGGDIGDITLNGGAGSDFYVSISGMTAVDIGFVTVTGGDSNASAGIWLNSTTADSIAGVDASTWAGDFGTNLAAVTAGTTILTGTGASWIRGTEGSDVIILGTGSDLVSFDDSPTAIDQIFGFQKAKDVMNFSGFADLTGTEVAVADNAAAAATSDGSVYVFADGSNTTTGETITDFTNLTDVAAFIAAAFSDEAAGDQIMAVINTGGGSAYVYYVDYDTGTGFNAASTTLIGVVAADGALTTANVLAQN